MPTITIGNTTISYTIEERIRRQHPAIQVDAQRRVTVLVPVGYPNQKIETMLQNKARWILTHVTAPPKTLSVPPKQFISGEGFLFRGHPLRLKVSVMDSMKPEVALQGRTLRVTIPRLPASQQPIAIRDMLVQWFYQQSVELLPQRVDYYASIVGIGPERLKIWEYKSRWGYCREDGLIALNWRIIQAPLSVMDYVVVHELTHRRYPHHRQTFWQAVEAVLPDFEAQKQWLRDHGMELGW